MDTQLKAEAGSNRSILPGPFSWRALLHTTAIADIIILTITGIVLPDRLPLGLALVIALGLWLVHFHGIHPGPVVLGGVPGFVVLGLIFGDTTFWTLSAAVISMNQNEELLRLVIPASLAAISGAGFVAASGGLLTRKNPRAGGMLPSVVAAIALVFFVLIMVGGVIAERGPVEASPAPDLVLTIENLRFSNTELTAKPGQVMLEVDNHDVWWHTFTIDGLGVDLRVPSSGKRQVSFAAAPGTYTFYCAIPGHAAMGMRGTLTIR